MLEAKRRAAIFLILAFILAAVAGYLILQKVEQLNSELGGMAEIYVALTDVPTGAKLSSHMYQTTEIPKKFLNENSHVTNKSDLENKVTMVALKKGDIITQNMLKGYSNLVNESNRTVAIPYTEKIVFDQELVPLDRVDIIVSHEVDGKKKTEVFMKDVLVTFADEKDFKGVAVIVPVDEVPNLVHMQNYAEHIRIIKSNNKVELLTEAENTEAKSETPKETKPAVTPATKPAATNPPSTPPASPPANQPAGNTGNTGTNTNTQGSGGK